MVTIPTFWQHGYWERVASSRFFESETESSGELRIFFSEDAGRVKVPGRATFGGWWPVEGTEPSIRDYFVAQQRFEASLGKDFSLSITLPPDYFFPDVFGPQREMYRSLGYRLVEETNQTAEVVTGDLPALSRGNWKKVRQFAAVGNVGLASDGEYSACFDLLVENRKRRGVQLSMDRAQFLENLTERPQHYACWRGKIGDRIVGAAYTVDLADHVTYVLYWGDSPEGRTYSVVASLFCEIWNNALESGKEFLDLGKSSTGGQLDNGLARFKRNLSAQTWSQHVWEISRSSRNAIP